MGSEAWFQEYEKLYNEREAGEISGTDEELAEKANEALADKKATLIDQARDRKKEGL